MTGSTIGVYFSHCRVFHRLTLDDRGGIQKLGNYVGWLLMCYEFVYGKNDSKRVLICSSAVSTPPMLLHDKKAVPHLSVQPETSQYNEFIVKIITNTDLSEGETRHKFVNSIQESENITSLMTLMFTILIQQSLQTTSTKRRGVVTWQTQMREITSTENTVHINLRAFTSARIHFSRVKYYYPAKVGANAPRSKQTQLLKWCGQAATFVFFGKVDLRHPLPPDMQTRNDCFKGEDTGLTRRISPSATSAK